MDQRFEKQLEKLSLDSDFKLFVKNQSTAVNDRMALRNIIQLKGNQRISELKVLALEEQQRNKPTQSILKDSGVKTEILREFDEKYKKQSDILSNNIRTQFENRLGSESLLLEQFQNVLNAEDICSEEKKSKKTQLELKSESVDEIKALTEESYKELLDNLSENIESFTKRMESHCSKELSNIGGTFIFDKGQILDSSETKTIVNRYFSDNLDNTSSEIFSQKIGQQLVQARMIPMYLMMGVSMFGFGSLSKYRKFMGPILILIMGIAFYMIYNNKMKEEAEEKEKAYKQIRERAKDKYDRILSDLQSHTEKKVKSYTDNYKTGLRTYMRNSVQNLGVNDQITSRTSSRKAKENLQKFERDMEKLLTYI